MPTDTWPQPVLELLAGAGTRPVFEDGDRIVTGTEMLGLVRRIAAGFRATGIGVGTGVALQLSVSAEAFAATIAAFAVGARVSGIPPGLTTTQLAQLRSVDDATLIDDARLADLAATPDDGLPLIAAGRPEDVARIVYTSGSTGHPKGCAHTYAAMTSAWAAHPDRWPEVVAELAGRLQRYLVFGSLSSQVMLEYGVLALAAGGTLVAARPPVFPDAIVNHRATASVITVGKLYQLVREQQQHPVDLSTLRALMVSGSPIGPARLVEALQVLGPVLFHGYGQTETGMISMVTPTEMLTDRAALASVGRPPTAVDVSVRDGELYVRTPSQASAYWGDPDETARVFVDGWVRTRDLAEHGDDGYLRLLGRARDVIIVNAELVHAGPIERTLASAPSVAEAYVVAAADEVTGEAPHAFVVPRPGAVPDPSRLQHLVRTQLGQAAVPQTITVIDRAPLAPSGKPDKTALRQRCEAAAGRVSGPPVPPPTP
jgi:fatty-acyl-CoA synthase